VTNRVSHTAVQEIQLSVFNALLKGHDVVIFQSIDQKVKNLNRYIVNPFHSFQIYPVNQQGDFSIAETPFSQTANNHH